MENFTSWADAIHTAPTPQDKAWVHLQRALGRGSKQLIAADIDQALRELGRSYSSGGYLLDSGLPWTQQGLHAAARKLLDEIAITKEEV